MKIAFFSPLPPAKSGIADYSAALLDELNALAEVTAFASKPARFRSCAVRYCALSDRQQLASRFLL